MDGKTITYAKWLKLVRESCKKGRTCEEFEELRISNLDVKDETYDSYIAKELAELETGIIRDSLENFQKAINKSLEENDIYIFEKGARTFKTSIKDCVFFEYLNGYSDSMRKQLKESISMNYLMFLDEFDNYLKMQQGYGNYQFLEEMGYIYKKVGIKKCVRELTEDE